MKKKKRRAKERDKIKSVTATEPKFPVPSFVQTAAYAIEQKGVDSADLLSISLPQSPIPASTEPASAAAEPFKEQKHMTTTLTYKGLNKKGNAAIYSGARTTIRIALANFDAKVAPQTIEVSRPFVAAAQPKVKMTREERKAAWAARPKPTLAERAAAARVRADKLAAAVAAALQPSM